MGTGGRQETSHVSFQFLDKRLSLSHQPPHTLLFPSAVDPRLSYVFLTSVTAETTLYASSHELAVQWNSVLWLLTFHRHLPFKVWVLITVDKQKLQVNKMKKFQIIEPCTCLQSWQPLIHSTWMTLAWVIKAQHRYCRWCSPRLYFSFTLAVVLHLFCCHDACYRIEGAVQTKCLASPYVA